MDTRDGTIYASREQAEAAGVPDKWLVTGSREALEQLRVKLKFPKKRGPWGRIQNAEQAEK